LGVYVGDVIWPSLWADRDIALRAPKQPTKFEFVNHLETARALGLAMPRMPLARSPSSPTDLALIGKGRLWGMKTRSRDRGRTAGVGSVKRTSPMFGAMGEKRR
jgi:hypothetical protein